MREICVPGSMSGEEKRSDGLLGERSNERRRAHLAPPVLYATALLLDSTRQAIDDCISALGFPFLVVEDPRDTKEISRQ